VNGLLIAVVFPSADYLGSFEVVFVMLMDDPFEIAFALKSAED